MKKTFGNIIFYGISAILLFVVACQVGLLPMRFTYFLSGSMRPSYQPGDMAFLYVGKNIQVNTGDVVLFSAEGKPTMHRAVAVENGTITTQGDANNTPDKEKITRVDGKLLFAIPKIGYVINYIQIPFRGLAQLIQGSG